MEIGSLNKDDLFDVTIRIRGTCAHMHPLTYGELEIHKEIASIPLPVKTESVPGFP